MIDKVSRNVPAGYAREVQSVSETAKTEAAKARQADPSAEVDFSKEAQFLQRITQAAHDVPEVRDDVVQAVKSQIETGAYQVNQDKLAENILSILA